MKTFLFSVCTLAILVGVILINAAYVKQVTSELQDALTDLPECAQASEEAQAILSRWKAEEKLLELSVSTTDINECGNQLTTLYTAARLNDKETFERARDLCLLTLSRIHDLERFKFHHIL